MPTYYRPTEGRGKRVIYRSTDPAAARRHAILQKVVLIVAFVFFCAVLALMLARALLSSREM